VNVCDKSGTHKETIQGTRTNTMKLSRTKHNPDSALLEDRRTRVMAKFTVFMPAQGPLPNTK